MKCADCGQRLVYEPYRYAYRHKERPADDHAPRPVQR